jgi:predicted GIY-YIG superfamily endonuclease
MAHVRKRPWFVYLLRCADGSLYTGITTDVLRRLRQHNAGTASKYTRSRLPVLVVHVESHPTLSHALHREAFIKTLPRIQKEALLRQAA